MNRLLFASVCAPLLVSASPQEPAERPDGPPRGLQLATDEAAPGYTLIAPLRSYSTYLLDGQGRVVHRWKSQYAPGNSVYLQADGSILRCGRDGDNPVFSGGGEGGYVERIAWDGTLLWKLDWSDEERLQHHDIAPLPNGNVILIAWERKTREEAIAAGRDPAQVGEDGLWPDYLVEIEPTPPEGGKVVWEWHAWDHLIQDFDRSRANHGDVTAHPERIDLNADHRDEPPLSPEERERQEEMERQMRALGYVGDDEDEPRDEDEVRRRGPGSDWLHTNGVDHHPELDLLVLSIHSLSEIWIVDHSTTTEEAAGSTGGRWGKGGDLLYRWGNPRTYGAPGARTLFAQHDAQWIPPGSPGEGNLLLFNNGQERPSGEYSSADELAPPFDPERGFLREPRTAFGPRELVWSYGEVEGPQHFYSSFISGAQRLPNGNTLICSGAQGRVFEVTHDFRVVWDYRNPYGGEVRQGERRRRGGDGDGPPGRGPDGPPPDRGGPERGRPPGPDGPPGDGDRRGPGGRGDVAKGLFRATRVAPDHPGLAGRELVPIAIEEEAAATEAGGSER